MIETTNRALDPIHSESIFSLLFFLPSSFPPSCVLRLFFFLSVIRHLSRRALSVTMIFFSRSLYSLPPSRPPHPLFFRSRSFSFSLSLSLPLGSSRRYDFCDTRARRPHTVARTRRGVAAARRRRLAIDVGRIRNFDTRRSLSSSFSLWRARARAPHTSPPLVSRSLFFLLSRSLCLSFSLFLSVY